VARLDPSAIAFFNLGTLSMKSGRSAEARAAFERALRLEPDHAEASNSLGALLAQSGDVEGAIARFRAALKTRPQFADALNNLGYALFQSGQDQAAFELYQEALAIQPDFPEALNNLGIYFGQRGELEQAGSCFERAVAARPTYGEAANNLALVLAARGDLPGAIALLQRYLEREPGFEPSYVTLAKIYLGGGRKREATQVLGDVPASSRLLDLQREAADRLKQAADAGRAVEERLRLLLEAGLRFESLGAEPTGTEKRGSLPSGMRAELRQAAAELRAITKPPFALEPHMALLERVAARLRGEPPLGLSFQGSYAQTKVAEPAVGGHASAMGPAPIQVPASADGGPPSPVQFEEVGGLTTRTYCGGKTKDHILESAGNGVALSRLRRRRQARRLPRHCRRAQRQARAHPATEHALPEPRRVEVRGRFPGGGGRRRGLGQRRLRRRLRRRRPARPLRDELGAELPLPERRQRRLRRGGGEVRGGGRGMEHGLRVSRRGP
jgi:Tfp pilus assembly protein PilF